MESDRWARESVPLRGRLVRRIADAGAFADPGWRAAFARVPRHLFVPAFHRPVPGGAGHDLLRGDDPDPLRRSRWLSGVYEDVPLATRVRGGAVVSASSQPSLMAVMLGALGPGGGRVLEIGTGTGWNAALLADRFGGASVTTVDLDPVITGSARGHLADCGRLAGPADAAAVEVVTGDGASGCPSRAPFDRIIATCELLSLPAAWLGQCAPGALVLAPLAGGLAALRVDGRGRAEGRFLHTPAYFLALRGPGEGPHPRPRAVADDARVRRSGTPPRVLDDDVFRFVLALAAGSLTVSRAYGGRGVALTAPDGSAARADRDALVEVSGERDLWAEVERAHATWWTAGRPDRERFGVSVADGRQWAWLDAPDGPHAWELTGR